MQNKPNDKKNETNNVYKYYLRPYITFWSAQNLLFDEIVSLDQIPKQREPKYSRYVLEKLGRTWLSDDPDDTKWFDQKTVFDELKRDLVLRLYSKYIFKSDGKIFKYALQNNSVF